ncbi:hypothetical protein CVT24_005275 [Panaeolus cyanescens]|uniref:Uncharacterized protein n=1 Tax=Panaeolus cyanescens TaxID=181874 RepID=A0A409Y979_9AGAR|nr:hypothetical protein CVT24_005275 [Panaeolus cyanescens]
MRDFSPMLDFPNLQSIQITSNWRKVNYSTEDKMAPASCRFVKAVLSHYATQSANLTSISLKSYHLAVSTWADILSSTSITHLVLDSCPTALTLRRSVPENPLVPLPVNRSVKYLEHKEMPKIYYADLRCFKALKTLVYAPCQYAQDQSLLSPILPYYAASSNLNTLLMKGTYGQIRRAITELNPIIVFKCPRRLKFDIYLDSTVIEDLLTRFSTLFSNFRPSIHNTVNKLEALEIRLRVAFCSSPHNSDTPLGRRHSWYNLANILADESVFPKLKNIVIEVVGEPETDEIRKDVFEAMGGEHEFHGFLPTEMRRLSVRSLADMNFNISTPMKSPIAQDHTGMFSAWSVQPYQTAIQKPMSSPYFVRDDIIRRSGVGSQLSKHVKKGLMYSKEDVEFSEKYVMITHYRRLESGGIVPLARFHVPAPTSYTSDTITAIFNVVPGVFPDHGEYLNDDPTEDDEGLYRIHPKATPAILITHGAFLIMKQAAASLESHDLFRIYKSGAFDEVDYGPVNGATGDRYIFWPGLCSTRRSPDPDNIQRQWKRILSQKRKSDEEILYDAWKGEGNLWALVRPDRFPIEATRIEDITCDYTTIDPSASLILSLPLEIHLLICERLHPKDIQSLMGLSKPSVVVPPKTSQPRSPATTSTAVITLPMNTPSLTVFPSPPTLATPVSDSSPDTRGSDTLDSGTSTKLVPTAIHSVQLPSPSDNFSTFYSSDTYAPHATDDITNYTISTTSSYRDQPTSATSHQHHTKTGEIIGAVVGLIFAVALLVACIICFKRRRTSRIERVVVWKEIVENGHDEQQQVFNGDNKSASKSATTSTIHTPPVTHTRLGTSTEVSTPHANFSSTSSIIPSLNTTDVPTSTDSTPVPLLNPNTQPSTPATGNPSPTSFTSENTNPTFVPHSASFPAVLPPAIDTSINLSPPPLVTSPTSSFNAASNANSTSVGSTSSSLPVSAANTSTGNGAAIAGGIIGTLALTSLVLALLLYMRRRAKKEREGWTTNAYYEPSIVVPERNMSPIPTYQDAINNQHEGLPNADDHKSERYFSGYTEASSGYVEVPHYGYPQEKMGYAS